MVRINDQYSNEMQNEGTYTIAYDKMQPQPNVPSFTRGIPDEQRLMRYLFNGYERTVRPVRNASTPVVIRMGLTFTQIFDMDEKDQVLVTNVWLDQEWIDEFMKWDPLEFANISVLRVPCGKLWLPDIVLYNNADEYTDGLMPANVMIRYDGNIFWPIPTKLQSSCKVDVTYFPFDQQTCKMKFGSWTYDGYQVDITNRTSEVDLSNYVNNGEWELLSITIVRNVVTYGCCDDPFPDVTFTIKIRRRILYYMYNVIFPCIMMSALTLLVFCLPPDSGEKIALGITVLLAFSVFMLAVAENLPETSEFVPLISIYLTIVMALTSMSVIMTVFVLNLHHRGPNKRTVPKFMKEILLDRISPFLCLSQDSEVGNYINRMEERFIKDMSLKITLDNIQQALQNETILENDTKAESYQLGFAHASSLRHETIQENDTRIDVPDHTVPVTENDKQMDVTNDEIHAINPESILVSKLSDIRNHGDNGSTGDIKVIENEKHDNEKPENVQKSFKISPNIITEGQNDISINKLKLNENVSIISQNSIKDNDSNPQNDPTFCIHSRVQASQNAHALKNRLPPQRSPCYQHYNPQTRECVTSTEHFISSLSTQQKQSQNVREPGSSSGKTKRKPNSSLSKTNEEILNSLKRILEKHEREDKDYEIIQEWRRVAQCVDRILFFIFFIATMSSTIGILVVAPATQ
ncbi:hypothetical protein ACF0H5_012724 [Mactra antiquata]